MSSIVKVIELSSESSESWEDATRQAVERASRTLRNIRSIWVKEFEAVVESDQVTRFRVNVKISFLLDDSQNVENAGATAGP
jgi:flavin-binding protein dodecin